MLCLLFLTKKKKYNSVIHSQPIVRKRNTLCIVFTYIATLLSISLAGPIYVK